MTVGEVINFLKADSGATLEQTCDILIAGSYDTVVTGIATTFMATADVIRRAHQLGANLIITHEPTWFTGRDTEEWLQGDPVYKAKKALIDECGVAIWRYHDHMHMRNPDMIYEGLLNKLGWEQYAKTEGKAPKIGLPIDFVKAFHDFYEIPTTTLGELAEFFKAKLGMNTVRILGDPKMTARRVGILVGGGSLGLGSEEMPASVMREHDIDVMVCGDIMEWTIPAYVNDARQLGQNRALLILGHERSEEWGMEYLAKWLPTKIADIPAYFVDAGEPFAYV